MYIYVYIHNYILYIILLEYQAELHLIPWYRFDHFDPCAPATVCYSLALAHCNTLRQELCLRGCTKLNRGLQLTSTHQLSGGPLKRHVVTVLSTSHSVTQVVTSLLCAGRNDIFAVGES